MTNRDIGHLSAAMGVWDPSVLGAERGTFAGWVFCFRWRGGRQKLS